MNRCQPVFSRRLLAMLLLAGSTAAVLWPGHAQAQAQGVREFPPAAKRGYLVVTAPPEVLINGTAERLSPGVRIRDPNNLLVMSAALVGRKVVVNYTRDNIGQVQQVWILNPEEIKQKLPSQLAAAANDTGILSNIRSLFEPTPAPQDDGKTPYNQLPKYSR